MHKVLLNRKSLLFVISLCLFSALYFGMFTESVKSYSCIDMLCGGNYGSGGWWYEGPGGGCCDYSCTGGAMCSDDDRGGGGGPTVRGYINAYVFNDRDNNGDFSPIVQVNPFIPGDAHIGRMDSCNSTGWIRVLRTVGRPTIFVYTAAGDGVINQHRIAAGGNPFMGGGAHNTPAYYCDSDGYPKTHIEVVQTDRQWLDNPYIVDISLDTMPAGYRIIRTRIRRGRCEPMDYILHGYTNPTVEYANNRNIFFHCDDFYDPFNFGVTNPQIEILISNQTPAPTCQASACAPSVVDPEAGTNFNISMDSVSSMPLLLNELSMEYLSSSPNITFSSPSLVNGTYVGHYRSSVTAAVSNSAPNFEQVNIIGNLRWRGNTLCLCQSSVTITNDSVQAILPWWQVYGGDVIAVDGDIGSPIPTAADPSIKFIAGNYGTPIFSGSLNLVPGDANANLSTTRYNAQSETQVHTTASLTNYNYDYFIRKYTPASANLPATMANLADWNLGTYGETKDGYEIYRRNGDLTIEGINSASGNSRKMVVFVSGNLNINDKINIRDGVDFLMFVVGGKIIVADDVGDSTYVASGTANSADIEGIYITNKSFVSSTAATVEQLYVRGSIIAYGEGEPEAFELRNLRDLGTENETYPSEVFESAPDQLIMFPPFFSEKSITWKEVAP